MLVVAVCSANVCRSPAAEVLLSRSIGADDSVRVVSAGLSALVGSTMDVRMAELVEADDAFARDFSARQLTRELALEADLLLAMTREHRRGIVRTCPERLTQTFTLLELARYSRALKPSLDQGPGAAATPMAEVLNVLVGSAARSRTPPGRPESDDVSDPRGGRPRHYRRAVRLIEDAVEAIASTASSIMTGQGQP